jgi:soluble lytic murein transglycosylase-like protein
MKTAFIVAILCMIPGCWAQTGRATERVEAEYYVTSYAQHYRVPIALARAIVVRESNWQGCSVSVKGAVGLMQRMPGRVCRRPL